jgi:predicted TIM-barrel enzyme
LNGRFCINLVLAFDQRERLELSLEERARVFSLSWGIDRDLISRAREAGALVLVQVGAVGDAVKAADAGADVVIAQGIATLHVSRALTEGGAVSPSTPASSSSSPSSQLVGCSARAHAGEHPVPPRAPPSRFF